MILVQKCCSTIICFPWKGRLWPYISFCLHTLHIYIHKNSSDTHTFWRVWKNGCRDGGGSTCCHCSSCSCAFTCTCPSLCFTCSGSLDFIWDSKEAFKWYGRCQILLLMWPKIFTIMEGEDVTVTVTFLYLGEFMKHFLGYVLSTSCGHWAKGDGWLRCRRHCVRLPPSSGQYHHRHLIVLRPKIWVLRFPCPQVIMNISEHWTRVKAQEGRPVTVYGALIGRQVSFQVPPENKAFNLYNRLTTGWTRHWTVQQLWTWLQCDRWGGCHWQGLLQHQRGAV